jgi:protein-tyrosine-phosphatase
MSIGFICNQNLARSQALGAFFSSYLIDVEIISAGVIAKENKEIPANLQEIFLNWGFETRNMRSKNLFLHWEQIKATSTLLCLTDFISEIVTDLGYKGRIVNLEDMSRNFGIPIRDPQLLPRSATEFELSKIIWLAVNALKETGDLPRKSFSKALIPTYERQLTPNFLQATAEKYPDHLILCSDIVAPLRLTGQSGFTSFDFNPKTNSFELPSDVTTPAILIPRFSVLSPQAVYLSSAWTGLVEMLETYKVIQITPPLNVESGMNSLAYLAAIQAEEIELLES